MAGIVNAKRGDKAAQKRGNMSKVKIVFRCTPDQKKTLKQWALDTNQTLNAVILKLLFAGQKEETKNEN